MDDGSKIALGAAVGALVVLLLIGGFSGAPSLFSYAVSHGE